MYADSRPDTQYAGACRLLAAGCAILLLALAAVIGVSLSAGSRSIGATEAVVGQLSAGMTADDAGGTVAPARSAAFAKAARSQVLSLGGSGPDSDPHLAAPPTAAAFHPARATTRENGPGGPHRAASGQLTRRAPTGPPAPAFLAL